ncbi:MAG: tRNA guanosine(34) transglycosylase Tgt [Candidatus Caenarcaniphilales bacterium]|nr:tRNA guanosine(34) transglycosylase Tgt [Candidatus Caenarcaniphilales bacterium]
MKFTLQKVCPKTGARAGLLETEHGVIETPVFMPVATKGSVRGIPWETIKELGAQIVLANTYHLHIRPGDKLIQKAGGLHKWSNWSGPFLTDSGGFQVFSFARRGKAKIMDSGVTFKDDLEGKMHFMGPKESMEIQKNLGSDIVMAFDHCPPADATREGIDYSVNLTTEWTKQCMDYELQSHQSLFPIVQGGRFEDLRHKSLKELVKLDAPGYALGGVSVGESREEVDRIVQTMANELPSNKPRYLMGVGTPRDLLMSVTSGMDMFDCILPTRLSRHGSFFRKNPEGWKTESVTQKEFTEDFNNPIMKNCQCPTCSQFSRAYIKHLFKRSEITVYYYIAVHNLYTLINLTKNMRKAILEDRFVEFIKSNGILGESSTEKEYNLVNT